MSPFIGVDLFILNEGAKKVGYFKSEHISPGLSNDGLSIGPQEGHLTLPAEVYNHSGKKVTFLVIRSGIRGGMRGFGEELTNWVKSSGFSSVVILTSTLSPVLRERDSNRL